MSQHYTPAQESWVAGVGYVPLCQRTRALKDAFMHQSKPCRLDNAYSDYQLFDADDCLAVSDLSWTLTH